MRDRDGCLAQLKSIEREFLAIRLAAEALRDQSLGDSTILSDKGVGTRDLELAAERLEGTDLIRLFAEFEMGLRLYWATIRPTHPRTRDLIDGLTAYRRIPPLLTAATHLVRRYRNSLVHEESADIEPIPLPMARSGLCHFVSRLPENWS